MSLPSTPKLANPQFKRLARRAGVKRVGNVYDVSREFANKQLKDIVEKSVYVMKNQQLSTLRPQHVSSVLNNNLSFAMTTTKHNKKSYDSFNTYIYKILADIHPNVRINNKAITHMNNIIKCLGNEIADKAFNIFYDNKRKTITSVDIQTATRLVLSRDIAKYATDEGIKACTKFYATLQDYKSKGGERISSANRAGLLLSVPRVKRLFLERLKCNIGQGAPVYLTAILEYVITDILELAGNVCISNRRTRITPRNIMIAVCNDTELSKTFDNAKIELSDTGVIPHINKSLLTKSKPTKKSSTSTDTGTKKPHRYRPGTVAIREIRKQQKSVSRIFPAQTFKNIIKNLLPESDIRLGKGTCGILQVYIENLLIRIYRNANNIAITNKRETITKTDFRLVTDIMQLHPISN